MNLSKKNEKNTFHKVIFNYMFILLLLSFQIIFSVPVNVILKITDQDIQTIEKKQQHLKNILSGIVGSTDAHIVLPPISMNPSSNPARQLFNDIVVQFGTNPKIVPGVGALNINKGIQFNVQHLTDQAAKKVNEIAKKPHITLLGTIDIPQAQVVAFVKIVNQAITSTGIIKPIKVQFDRLGIVSAFPALLGHEIGSNNLDIITQKILNSLLTSQFKQNLVTAQAGQAFHSYNSKDPNALHVSLGTFSFVDTDWKIKNNWKNLTRQQQIVLQRPIRMSLSKILEQPFNKFIATFKMPISQINLCESEISYMDNNGHYIVPVNGIFNICNQAKISKDKVTKPKALQALQAKQFKAISDTLAKHANAVWQFKVAQQKKDAKKIKQLTPQINKIKKELTKIPVNIKNAQGQTPIMLNPRIAPIVYALPKNVARAFVNAKDKKGKTVLQYLITSPFADNINLYNALVNAGAKISNNDIKMVQNKLKKKPKQLKPIAVLLKVWQKKNK